ncbi:MAG: DUF6056 family protein [Oscillospiraceae bacterium]|jgi:hypothetical protein|nr:DUF6056 family protein [Oscillospiraceae bacterium]
MKLRLPRWVDKAAKPQWLALLLLAALLLSLVPLLVAGRYDVPSADDYYFSVWTRRAWTESGSLVPVLKAAVSETITQFRVWQGTLAAMFLFTLQPAVFGERLYALTPWVMLAALLLPTFYFIQGWVRRLGGQWHHTVTCAAPLLFLSVQYPVSAVQGFFWWNGAVYYTFFYGLMLWLLGLCLRLWADSGGRAKFTLRLVPAAALAVAAGWGNYTTALLTLVLLALCAGGAWLAKKPLRVKLALTALCTVSLAALLVSALAPGNAVRQTQFLKMTPWGAVAASIRAAKADVADWLDMKVLLAVLLPLPVLAPLLKNFSWDFRRPWLVTLASFLLFAAQNTPPLYAMGNSGPPRLRNIVFFAFLLLLQGNAAYWLSWWQRRGRQTSAQRDRKRRATPALPLGIALAFAAVCCLQYTQANAAICLSDLRHGRLQRFLAEEVAREERLRAPDRAGLTFDPFSDPPTSIFRGDIQPGRDHWRNAALANYYDKEFIEMKGDSSGEDHN